MRKDVFLFIVGLIVFSVPFLGIPEDWKEILLFILGGCVALGALLCRVTQRREERNQSEVYYEENEPQKEEDIEEDADEA